MVLSELLKMDQNDILEHLQTRLDRLIFSKAMEGIFSLDDYEFLLVELQKIWPCPDSEYLIDCRVRRQEKKMFAMAVTGNYTKNILELGECMPDAFAGSTKKPILFFFKNKEDALEYYHSILGITRYIWACCHDFWKQFHAQTRENLVKFAEEKLHNEQDNQWSRSLFYHVTWYQVSHNGGREILCTQNFSNTPKLLPESVPDPGVILQFALDWTREIWRH